MDYKKSDFMGILLDSGFIYALKDEDDNNHDLAEKILKELDWSKKYPVYVPIFIINETYTLMVYRTKGNLKKISSLDDFFWGDEAFFKIIDFKPNEYTEVAKLIPKYVSQKKLLSFVDLSLIYMGIKLKIEEIISFDSHFDGIMYRISDVF